MLIGLTTSDRFLSHKIRDLDESARSATQVRRREKILNWLARIIPAMMISVHGSRGVRVRGSSD
jgi:hypothetical protein